MAKSVLQEIGDHLPQLRFVALDHERTHLVDGDHSIRRARLRVGGGIRDHGAEVDGLTLQCPTLVQSRKQQKIVDEDPHAHRLVFDPSHRPSQVLRAVRGTPAEQLRVAAYRGHWRPKLVRRVRKELSETLLRAPLYRERVLNTGEHDVQ